MVVYLVQLFIVHDFVLESHFTGLCVHVCCLYDAELFQKALFEVFVPKKLEFKLVLELEELPGLLGHHLLTCVQDAVIESKVNRQSVLC